MKYTYDDIVTAKDILTGKVKKEDIIEKKGWFFDCIPQDMSLKAIENMTRPCCLKDVKLDCVCPFIPDAEDRCSRTYFLPEKEESAPIPRFKIGDRVKIVEEWIGFEGEYTPTIGKIGRIEEIDNDGTVGVLFDSDNDFWWYRLDAVELIEDEEPEICGSAIEEGPFECKEKSYGECQAEWVKANNLKPGDKVRILRTAENKEDGWGATWIPLMDKTVGEIGTVIDISNFNGIRVDCWIYPYFVLEKVDEPEYIPYDLSKPEDRDALRDKWVKSTNPDVFHEFKITQFVRMNDDYQTIYVKTSTSRYSGNDLFCDYVFADGSPVGKPANGQQIRQDIALKRIRPESGADSRQCSK